MDPVEVKKELRAISDEGDNDVDVYVDGDFVNDEWSNVADYSDDVDKNDNDVDFDVDIAATNVARKSSNQSRKKKTASKASLKTRPPKPDGPPLEGVDPEVRTKILIFQSYNCEWSGRARSVIVYATVGHCEISIGLKPIF